MSKRARQRQERDNIFRAMIDAGFDSGYAGSIANNPNIHSAHKGFHRAMRNPPGKPTPPPAAPTPPPMPKMETYKPPQMANATSASLGKGVGKPQEKKKKSTLASLRIRRQRPTRVGGSLGGGFGTGTGLNVGGLTG